MLAKLADDKSTSAISTLLSGQNPIRIVRSQLEAIADGESYSKQAVFDWAINQKFEDEISGLELAADGSNLVQT